MKKLRYWLLSLVLATVGSLVIRVPPAFAANASLYLSPSSRSVTQGSTLYIAVRVAPNGNAVNAAQANLSYPTDKFDFISVSCSSTFSITAQATGGGGSVKLGCGQIGTGVTGDTQIGTVGLRARTSSGSATVSFASGSNVASNGNNVTGALSGASYTFAAAPVAAPKDTTPPKISGVTVSDVSYHSATVSWTTDEGSTSVVEFGLTDGLGLTAQTDGTGTAHKVVLPGNQLVPGTKYRYRVKSVDAAGNAATSDLADLVIPGITVQVKVVNAKQKPLANAKVLFIIENVSATTDKNGLAKFDNQVPGKRSLSVSLKGATVAQAIEIKDNPDQTAFTQQNLGNQTFTVSLPVKGSFGWLTVAGIGIGGLLAGAALAFGGYKLVIFILRKRRTRKEQKQAAQPVVEQKNEPTKEPQAPPQDEPADLPVAPAPPPAPEPLKPESTSSSVTDLGPQPAVAFAPSTASPQPVPAPRRYLDITPSRPTVRPPAPTPIAQPAPPTPVAVPIPVATPAPAPTPPAAVPYILKETPPPTVPATAPTPTAAPAQPTPSASVAAATPPPPVTIPVTTPQVTAPTPAPAPPVNPLPTMSRPVPAQPVTPVALPPKPAAPTPTAAPAQLPISKPDAARLQKEGFTIAPPPQVIHPDHYRTPDE